MLLVVLLVGVVLVVGGGLAAARRRLAVAAGVGGPGLLVTGWSVDRAVVWLDGAGLLPTAELAAAAVPVFALTVWHRWTHTRGRVHRSAAGHRRREGVATVPQLLSRASRLALLRQARVLRPSLRALSWWRRWCTHPTQLGVRLVRTGMVTMWAAIEDVVVVFGRPRVGKSTWLIRRILDAPGAVVCASTKADLWAATHAARGHVGPIWVFNPSGEGDAAGEPIPSTLRFDPVIGCGDPVVAMERAEDMIPSSNGGGDREHWTTLAREAFGALLYAAAVSRSDMAAVGSWVAHADNPNLVLELETLVEDRDPIMADRLRAFLSTNDKTRTSITSSMSPALAWLAHPGARQVAAGGHTLDVAELIRTGATVYLIGGVSGATAGLLAALTGHIAREARRLAGRVPGGRLDPPLRLALDEADRICPVPLPTWVADMGGRGITIIASFQARSQIIDRWGLNGAKTIIDCAGAIVLYAMATDSDEADYWSRAIGTRDEETITRDGEGFVTSRSSRTVPIVPPAQLRMLRRFQAVVLRAGCGPVIGYPARPPRRRAGRQATGVGEVRPPVSPTAGDVSPASPTPGNGTARPRVRPRPIPRGWAPGNPAGRTMRSGEER
ncbi:MAG TPA: TraM recognition domain-containing protein [Pseudonocardia sp.]